jgi:hypothetical protein
MVDSDSAAELSPWIERFAQKDAHLMTDENRAYQQIGKQYAGHSSVTHSAKECVRGIRPPFSKQSWHCGYYFCI